jgi:hypothetical protein
VDIENKCKQAILNKQSRAVNTVSLSSLQTNSCPTPTAFPACKRLSFSFNTRKLLQLQESEVLLKKSINIFNKYL